MGLLASTPKALRHATILPIRDSCPSDYKIMYLLASVYIFISLKHQEGAGGHLQKPNFQALLSRHFWTDSGLSSPPSKSALGLQRT